MRNILVAVLGSTPAILTEAIYYYARLAEQPVLFSEIHVYTTGPGRKLACEQLFGTRQSGQYFALLKTLHMDVQQITFGENNIHAIIGADGLPLADVRTKEESLCVADQLCAGLQKLRADDDVVIYATMAGGRKTMGIYLTMAMQLLSRAGDRLFHVLPDPRIEEARMRDFYFPCKTLLINGKKILPSDIRIDCDEVPLLHWPWSQGVENFTFSELQARRQREVDWSGRPPSITFDLRARKVSIGEQAIETGTTGFLWYAYFAQRVKRLGEEPASLDLSALQTYWERLYARVAAAQKKLNGAPLRWTAPQLRDGHLPLNPENAREHAALMELEALFFYASGRGDEADFALRMNVDLSSGNHNNLQLRTYLSKLAGELKRVLGPLLAEHYSIRQTARGSGTYWLAVAPERIKFVNGPKASTLAVGTR